MDYYKYKYKYYKKKYLNDNNQYGGTTIYNFIEVCKLFIIPGCDFAQGTRRYQHDWWWPSGNSSQFRRELHWHIFTRTGRKKVTSHTMEDIWDEQNKEVTDYMFNLLHVCIKNINTIYDLTNATDQGHDNIRNISINLIGANPPDSPILDPIESLEQMTDSIGIKLESISYSCGKKTNDQQLTLQFGIKPPDINTTVFNKFKGSCVLLLLLNEINDQCCTTPESLMNQYLVWLVNRGDHIFYQGNETEFFTQIRDDLGDEQVRTAPLEKYAKLTKLEQYLNTLKSYLNKPNFHYFNTEETNEGEEKATKYMMNTIPCTSNSLTQRAIDALGPDHKQFIWGVRRDE